MLFDMTDLARTLTFTPSLSLSWISSNDRLIFLPQFCPAQNGSKLNYGRLADILGGEDDKQIMSSSAN